MTKKIILLVEDNAANARLVKATLSDRYTVLTAENAEEALEILKKTHPALILMDIQLPSMSGLQLTRILRQNPETKNIVIIALTALAMDSDAKKALGAGCEGYISKPFNVRTLAAEVEAFLGSDSSLKD